MLEWTLLLTVALGSASAATECANPPARTSDLYWDYIDACGCSQLDPPSRASQDYSRHLKACSSWRERNQGTVVSPADPARPGRECDSAPSRVSEAYWEFIDACGCSKVDPPPSSSSDYPRYLKMCGQWREKNPAATPTATPTPKPTPKPTPGKKP